MTIPPNPIQQDNSNKADAPAPNTASALASSTVEATPKASYDDFKKIEMRVGLIKTAEPVPGTDKLLRLTVDFGEATPRQVVSGIAQRTTPEAIIGTKAIFVTNLEVRTIRGLESQAMILGASEKDVEGKEIAFGIARLDKECSPGALIG